MSILTTAIGLILVYLILSLITSAIQEGIASLFTLRGKHLARALDQMLTNENEKDGVRSYDQDLLHKFLNHSFYQSLKPDQKKTQARINTAATNNEAARQQLAQTYHPSYMEASTFVTIFMHILDGTDIKTLKKTLDELSEGRLKTFLLDTLKEAEDDLSKFRELLENWYNEVMSRASGWYKRHTHKLIIIIGLLLGAYFNADSLAMYQKMASSTTADEQTEQIIALAQNMIDARQDTSFAGQISRIQANRALLVAQPDSNFQDNLDSIFASQNLALLNQTDSLVNQLQANSSPLGLGWGAAEVTAMKKPGNWPMKLLGLLITAMAISLGAPFWFDLLKKFMNIRNAGPGAKQS